MTRQAGGGHEPEEKIYRLELFKGRTKHDRSGAEGGEPARARGDSLGNAAAAKSALRGKDSVSISGARRARGLMK